MVKSSDVCAKIFVFGHEPVISNDFVGMTIEQVYKTCLVSHATKPWLIRALVFGNILLRTRKAEKCSVINDGDFLMCFPYSLPKNFELVFWGNNYPVREEVIELLDRYLDTCGHSKPTDHYRDAYNKITAQLVENDAKGKVREFTITLDPPEFASVVFDHRVLVDLSGDKVTQKVASGFARLCEEHWKGVRIAS